LRDEGPRAETGWPSAQRDAKHGDADRTRRQGPREHEGHPGSDPNTTETTQSHESLSPNVEVSVYSQHAN